MSHILRQAWQCSSFIPVSCQTCLYKLPKCFWQVLIGLGTDK